MTTEVKRVGGLPAPAKIRSAADEARMKGTLRKSLPQWLRDVFDGQAAASKKSSVRAMREAAAESRREAPTSVTTSVTAPTPETVMVGRPGAATLSDDDNG